VSRALGDHFVKQNGLGLSGKPFVSERIKLTDEDTFMVVASDGVKQNKQKQKQNKNKTNRNKQQQQQQQQQY